MTDTSLTWLPLVGFDRIEDDLADELLKDWGHWLGGCNRPFGRQSFGLALADVGIISVAVSASTVNETCGGYRRGEVVELARCASRPGYAWAATTANPWADSERRIERVFELGFMPFTQLYQPDELRVYPEEWRALRRKWSRPAAYMAKG